jgi:NADH dehydrogenase FAD-containing subunit
MGKHLVLVGAGHAHLTVLMNISDYVERGHTVSVIGPDDYHYYSGMGPGMLGGTYSPNEIRFNVKKMAETRGAGFVRGKVLRIDAARRVLHLEDGTTLDYDVVSFNTGSGIPLDGIAKDAESVYTVKPIINLLEVRAAIREKIKDCVPTIIIAGGGPAGVELAGNVWKLVTDNRGKAEIILVAGGQALKNAPEKARSLALKSLRRRGLKIVEGTHVTRIEGHSACLGNGERLAYDLILPALGVKPSGIFKESGLPVGEDGGLLVNEYLQSVGHPEIFGGGDCICFKKRPLAKVGVYAVRQNPILKVNLLAALEAGALQPFEPQHTYMLIFNLGDGAGLFIRKNWVWGGRSAFWLKDYIDRSFMKKFQVSGERDEKAAQ